MGVPHRHRRQLRTCSVRVPGHVNGGIRNALEIFVDRDPPPVGLDVPRRKVETFDSRDPAGTVDDQIGVEDLLLARPPGPHPETGGGPLDRYERHMHLHVDPDLL